MSENHLHIPVSPFLLLSRGSVTFAAVDIHGNAWQVASGAVSIFVVEYRGSVTFAAVDIHGSAWQMASGVDDNGNFCEERETSN